MCTSVIPPEIPLAVVREELRAFPAPIVVFNNSHSGSRLLARLLEDGGIFMGAQQNGSGDSLDVLKLVENLVTRYYPDYAPMINNTRQPAGHWETTHRDRENPEGHDDRTQEPFPAPRIESERSCEGSEQKHQNQRRGEKRHDYSRNKRRHGKSPRACSSSHARLKVRCLIPRHFQV